MNDGTVTTYLGFRFVENTPLPTTGGLTFERLTAVRDLLNRNEAPAWILPGMLGERNLARGGGNEGTGAVWRANPEGLVRISCSTGNPGLNRKQRRAMARARLTLSRLPANHGQKMVPGRSDQLGKKRPVVLWSEEIAPLRFTP